MAQGLASELRRIEEQYLSAPLTDTQKAKPELVSFVIENIIQPALEGSFSGIEYTGSAYEYTTVPGRSDFDVQFCIKVPSGSVQAEDCGEPAWRRVRGGPSNLLDGGYLSTDKVRTMIQSKIDKTLRIVSKDFEDSPLTIRRSISGPATTLNVEWKGETVSIDVVACVKAEDVDDCEHDLVGKPYNQGGSQPYLWRLSYSKQEREKLRKSYSSSPRMLTLLRIMKVIKQHNSQLGYFPSYFYKNILFMLSDSTPQVDNWQRADLAKRFKDMINLMCDALKNQSLPVYFNQKVNYLDDYDKTKIQEVANYLQSIVRKNQYIELVNCVPATRNLYR